MDERLEKALEFSNYVATINNQKENIRQRVAQLQIVHHTGGVFLANQETISFVKTMIDMEHTTGVLIDSKGAPVQVKSFKELLEKLVSAYHSSANELDAEYTKLKKVRNLKTLME